MSGINPINERLAPLRLLLGLLPLALFLTACRPPESIQPVRPAATADARRPNAHPQPTTRIVGTSIEGRPIEAIAIGQARPTTLILATIHGHEAAGTPLVRRLMRTLAQEPSAPTGPRVVAVPLANPDGHHHRRRHNARGVDLNRNFPAANWTASTQHGRRPLSEPESRAIASLIRAERPDRVISFHQPLACIDYDGPGEMLAGAMANASGLPVRQLGGRAGSLGSYVGETLGIPTITVELPLSAARGEDETLWRRYGAMLLVAVRFGAEREPGLAK